MATTVILREPRLAADWFDTSTTQLNYSLEPLESPSGPNAASAAIVDSKGELNQVALSLAPTLGSTDKRYSSATAEYTQEVKATDKIDFQSASAAAWKDFHKQIDAPKSNDPITTAIDTTSFGSMEQLSQNPDTLQKALIQR